ncbi:MAG: trypsin-like peptidase domain-containing protein [Ruminococcus sp.]|nr:trypsin-like peptidase domain-containing protein [Ruminococcus sp.]
MNRGNNEPDGRNSLVTPDQNPTENKASSGEKEQNNAAAENQDTPSWLELSAREDSITIPEIVQKITPSVVGIQATFMVQTQNDYFSGFGGFGFGFNNGGTQTQEAVGTGTGVIMSEDGYIITNAHVIYDSTSGYGAAKSVEVQLSDQETVYPAEVVAYDVESDLAVLKVDQTGLTPAEFGNSDECMVGELVVAIGNPLGLELQNTVTCGIISAMNREITINDKEMTLIQTDTAINSGNSGGPLINSAGQVIGINSAKMSSSYSSTSATIEGIGFAIPITEAKEIVDDLITYGYVTGRPQLGITCQDVSEAVSQAYNIPVGSYIISITEGGAADKAGLQIQDVIIAIDGQTITSTEELNDYKNQHDAGEQVVLTIVRAGQQMEVTVVLEEAVAVTE